MESSTTPSKTLPRIETCSEKEDRNQEYQTGGHPLAVPLQELQDETMATEMENDRAFASAEIYRPITASRSRDTSRSKESQSIMLYKDDHVVKCKNFLDLGLEMHDLDPELFFPLRRPDNRAWWLDVQNAAPDTVRQVCRVFGVHPLTVEDIAAEESGEKIVTFPSYYFTCVRSFVQKTRFDAKIEYEPFNFYMVVFDSGVLSFSFVAHAHVDKVLERVQNLADHVCITPDFIHYAIL
jgi:Mg2+ and Co2+ transporter CorA